MSLRQNFAADRKAVGFPAVNGAGQSGANPLMNASVQPSREHVQSVLHEAIAEGSLEIPPPPQVASDILRITRDEGESGELDHDDAEELSQLIQRDLALASQVMRVANSALYARR